MSFCATGPPSTPIKDHAGAACLQSPHHSRHIDGCEAARELFTKIGGMGAARGIQGGGLFRHESMHALPGHWDRQSAMVLEVKKFRLANIDQARRFAPKMERRAASNRFFGLCCISQVDGRPSSTVSACLPRACERQACSIPRRLGAPREKGAPSANLLAQGAPRARHGDGG